jgi:hypothetical protein
MTVCGFFAPRRSLAQEIRVVTTASTNLDSKIIHTTNTFIRGDMTNLVTRTLTKNESVQMRIQRVYHDGMLLGEIEDDKVNGLIGISAEPNRPYELAFQFYKDRSLQSVVVGTNGVILDAFECTNGILYPTASDKIAKANEIGVGMKELFDPNKVRGESPEEFQKGVRQFIEQNKNK